MAVVLYSASGIETEVLSLMWPVLTGIVVQAASAIDRSVIFQRSW